MDSSTCRIRCVLIPLGTVSDLTFPLDPQAGPASIRINVLEDQTMRITGGKAVGVIDAILKFSYGSCVSLISFGNQPRCLLMDYTPALVGRTNIPPDLRDSAPIYHYRQL